MTVDITSVELNAKFARTIAPVLICAKVSIPQLNPKLAITEMECFIPHYRRELS